MNQNPSTAPDRDQVIHHAKTVRDKLERTIVALPGRGTVTEQDLTGLGAALRGLAKKLDQHSRVREAAPATAATSGQQHGRVWTYPGQQR